MIDVKDVYKSYGPVQALNDVSFHVDAGEIIGLLGPNGAGKTTMMKILTGYLQMIADLRRIPTVDQPALLSSAVRATGLERHLVRPIGQLSKGFRQRVGLAQAIVHRPKLLILDEPTIGLDPTQIVEVRHLIRRLAQQSTVVLSTHILSEVEAVCDRVIILLNGEVRADARIADLEAATGVILIVDGNVPGVEPALRALDGVTGVEPLPGHNGAGYRVSAAPGSADLRPAVYALARECAWPLVELRRDVRTLEAVFNDLVTTTTGGAA